MAEDRITDVGDDRVSVPLMMLRGNLECLLENTLPVNGISLKWYGPAGVILVVHGVDREVAEEIGFQTKKATDE
jgi:hypothetical protein